MSRPTLSIVAQRAGVSVATVSRSVHGDPSVVAETRDHVLRVCEELGYRPSPAARRLKQGAKAVVGLSLGASDHPAGLYVSLMHQALSRQFAQSGWSVELIRRKDFHAALDVGGLILIGVLENDPRLLALEGSDIPVVAVGHDAKGFRVAPDDVLGAGLAVSHLIGAGRKKLAILGAYDAAGNLSLRIRAAIAAARASGIEPELIDVQISTTPTLQGYRAVARRLAAGRAFDGLFCETDEMALGALAALEDAGVNVPADVALIGFDDLPEFAGRLTTVRQDIPAIATAAIDLLSEARRGSPGRAVLLPVTLVERETA